jgi:hypothetical protein
MSMKNQFQFHLLQRRSALVILGLLAALPNSGTVRGDEPAGAGRVTTINVTAVVVPPTPRLAARTAGGAVLIEADLPPTVERLFSLIPTGDGQWAIVLATYDGAMLATYQYPLSVGSLPVPPPPGPQPEPTPAPPLSRLAKVALDAAMETVPADGRSDEAANLAGAIEVVLKRCETDYPGDDKLTDPAALRSAMPAAAEKVLAKANDRWVAWAEKVAVEMDRLQAAGELADLAAYREAYHQIIRGLREIK